MPDQGLHAFPRGRFSDGAGGGGRRKPATLKVSIAILIDTQGHWLKRLCTLSGYQRAVFATVPHSKNQPKEAE